MSDSFGPHGLLQGRILEWVVFPSPGDLSNPGIKPRSPALKADSVPAEPQGNTRAGNLSTTRVGSLSLLQQIFPTQESNRGLLHCRQIFLPTELSGKPRKKGGKDLPNTGFHGRMSACHCPLQYLALQESCLRGTSSSAHHTLN